MDGILNVLKPPGMTSHDVVSFVRKCTGIRKIGHTGTLDPGAAGVLPICIGKATKIAELLSSHDKMYRAEIKLGVTTETQDSYGKVLSQKPVDLTEDDIQKAVHGFIGEIQQIPPMYSAIKVNGQKLYELARKGVEVQRNPRTVTIYSVDIIHIDFMNHTVLIDVHCSKGTYVRTLCADIGEKLGCGAHMSFLLRTKSGNFTLDKSITVEEIEMYSKEKRLEEFITPIDNIFLQYPKITVNPVLEKKIRNGNEIDIRYLGIFEKGTEMYRVYNENGEFLCLSKIIKKADRYFLKNTKSFY